jgi:hypothetical protein
MEDRPKPLSKSQLSAYTVGDIVSCRIAYAEGGGFHVVITKDGLPGVIRPQLKYKPGDEIQAIYVGIHGSRVALIPAPRRPPGDEQPGYVCRKPAPINSGTAIALSLASESAASDNR